MTVQRTVCAIAVILAGLVIGEAQITVPTVFTTSVPVSQLNTNFSTVADGALNRASGTITGNITVNNGVTVDGIDISAAMGAGATPAFTSMTLSSTGASALDVAGGINAGSGNVGIVDTSGRIPAISSTYFASLSGALLTGIPASTALTNTWTSVAYSAGNFTGGGTITWGVDAGDQYTYKYQIIGKTMTLAIFVGTTDVTGAGTDLRVALPAGAIAASSMRASTLWYNDAPTEGHGLVVLTAGNAYVQFYKANSGSNWTVTALDDTTVSTIVTFEIQ